LRSFGVFLIQEKLVVHKRGHAVGHVQGGFAPKHPDCFQELVVGHRILKVINNQTSDRENTLINNNNNAP
jgi:hypothetical protein